MPQQTDEQILRMFEEYLRQNPPAPLPGVAPGALPKTYNHAGAPAPKPAVAPLPQDADKLWGDVPFRYQNVQPKPMELPPAPLRKSYTLGEALADWAKRMNPLGNFLPQTGETNKKPLPSWGTEAEWGMPPSTKAPQVPMPPQELMGPPSPTLGPRLPKDVFSPKPQEPQKSTLALTPHLSPSAMENLTKFVGERKQQVSRDRAIRAIAEGLGKMNFQTAPEIRLGMPPQGSAVDTGDIDDRIAQNEQYGAPEMDPASPISRAAQSLLKETMGIDTQAPYSLLASQVPALSTAIAMRQRAQDGGATSTYRWTDTDKKAMDAFSLAMDSWDRIKQLKPGINTGPIPSIFYGLREKIGFPNVEWSTFKSQVADEVNQYIHDMTGAQLSVHEAKRLSAARPRMWDDDDLFMSKLDSTMQRIQEKHQVWVQNRLSMGAQFAPGMGTAVGGPGFDSGEVPEEAYGWPLLIGPGGEPMHVKPEDVEQALQEGYSQP